MGEPPPATSWDEYLALDDASEERHEFIDGQVFVMGGATLRHNRIVGNAFSALDRALRGKPCVALAGAQRVYVEATRMAGHPDVTVVCGPPKRMPDGRTLLNPSLLVEVLSPTSAASSTTGESSPANGSCASTQRTTRRSSYRCSPRPSCSVISTIARTSWSSRGAR